MSGATFNAALRQYRDQIADAQAHLCALGLDDALADLFEEAERAEFRVSVLGRFKQGKSTLLNVLLGEDLLPTDLLPCTSCLIEIRKGAKRRYTEMSGDRLEERDRAAFLAQAGRAMAGANSDARWRVTLPASWMPEGLVLVDTPGMDEDPGREATARAELQRTDAAVVLMRADQPGGLDDIDGVDDLRRRVGLVIVVFNRADRIDQFDHARVLDFARNRISARVDLPPERVLLVSAKAALDGEAWALEGFEKLRAVLSSVLFRNTAGRRLESLRAKTEHALAALEPRIKDRLGDLEKDRARAERAAAEAKAKKGEHSSDLQAARSIFESSGVAVGRRSRELTEARWGAMVREVLASKRHWRSDKDPLFSPKAFATEIAECAKAALEARVRAFVDESIRPTITEAVTGALREVKQRTTSIIAESTRMSFDDAGALEARIEKEALADAFGRSVEGASDTSSEAAVTAAVAGVVGYIIADIVLFYMLGAIAGFLNPVLLVAAAVTGGVAYLFKGRDWVKDWMRGKIADKLEKELLKPDVVSKVGGAVKTAADEVFGKIASSYERRLKVLLEEAKRNLSVRQAEETAGRAALVSATEKARAASESLRALVREMGTAPELGKRA